MAAQTQMSVKDKVDQLMNHTPWSQLKTSRPVGDLSGIYVIGEEVISERRGSKVNTVLYRYLGQSDDIGQRLPHHLKKSSAEEGREISKFIQDRKQEGLEETLMVKWIEEPNHDSFEGEYLEKLEMELGYELVCNIQRGNGINPMSDEKVDSQTVPSIKDYFKVEEISTTLKISRSDGDLSGNVQRDINRVSDEKANSTIIPKQPSIKQRGGGTKQKAKVNSKITNYFTVKTSNNLQTKTGDGDETVKPVVHEGSTKPGEAQLGLSFEKPFSLDIDDRSP